MPWDAPKCGRGRYMDDPEHGRNCPGCKAECARYNAEWRERVRDLPIPEHLHGRPGTYNNRKCRCDRCVAAHKAMRSKTKRRRKVAVAQARRTPRRRTPGDFMRDGGGTSTAPQPTTRRTHPTMTALAPDIPTILANHQLWLNGKDVERANLSGANLRGADLRGADLRGASLRGADLSGADLGGANLRGADLRGADLRRASLRDVDLSDASLRGASLRGADLSGADLRGASLSGASLRGADLRGASLSGANLRAASLRGADLRGASLSDADLSGASLSDADLSGASLRRANLRGASLSDADLSGASLSGASLRDVDLSGASLTGTCVTLLLDDDGRGYQVVAHAGLTTDGEPLYLAGCRQLTIAGSRKHWTNPNHDNPEAAARILTAIEAHHTAWETSR